MGTKVEERQKRRDPFYEPPLHKAHYHPSLIRDVTDKQVVLSADRPDMPVEDLSDIEFLQATNTYMGKVLPTGSSPADTSSKFDESWPNSERPSTIDIDLPAEPQYLPTRGQQHESPMKPISQLIADYKARGQGTLKNFDLVFPAERTGDVSTLSQDTMMDIATEGRSTLSKYLERFRHGAPTSRQERAQTHTTDGTDFWWLSSSPPAPKSSTPRTDTDTSEDKKVTRREKLASCTKEYSTLSAGSKMSSQGRSDVVLDSDTLRLMEKTERLLARSESSLNSSDPVVSTVGLGSSPNSTPASEAAYLPSFVFHTDKENVSDRVHRGQGRHVLNRDDDILYQWRKQRRLDVTRNKVSRMMKTGGPSARVIDDVESKLADFRKTLTSHQRSTPSSDARAHGATEIFTVDPVVVKNDASCQTSHATPDVAPLPVPKQPALLATFHPHSMTADQQAVAPPGGSEPAPHLHLSCDIVPCPHGHSVSMDTREIKQKHRLNKGSGHHIDDENGNQETQDRDQLKQDPMANMPPIVDGDRKCLHDNDLPERDHGSNKKVPPLVESSCSESDFESYKREHMARVAQEMDDLDLNSNDLDISNHYQRSRSPAEKDRSLKKTRGRSLEKDRTDSQSMSGERHRRSGKDERRDSKSWDRKRSRDSDKKTKPSADSSEHKPQRAGQHEESRGPSVKEQSNRPNQSSRPHERQQTSSKKHPDENKHNKPAGVMSKGRAKVTDRHVGHGTAGPYDSISDSSLHEVAPPLCQSSPKGKPARLTPTIQQVVTERLFIESEDEADLSPEGATCMDRMETESPTLVKQDTESNGEEFPADNILVEMLHRHSYYTGRLELIDSLLAFSGKT